MPRPPQDPAGPRVDPYRPLPRRRRWLVALLAVATAVVVIVELTSRWGVVGHARRHPPDVAACSPGQTAGCVGSKTEVLVSPAPAPATPSPPAR